MANESDNSVDIYRLIRKRVSVKGRLTKMKENFESMYAIDSSQLTNIQLKELTCRLDKCQTLFSSFDELQTDIEAFCDDLEIQLKERDTIESQFITLIASIQDLLETAKLPRGPGCSRFTSLDLGELQSAGGDAGTTASAPGARAEPTDTPRERVHVAISHIFKCSQLS
ncbi:hypothetical protein ACJJTC_010576 [Scirpophaga incertulas]